MMRFSIMLATLLAPLLALSFVDTALAKQTHFDKQPLNDGYVFTYQWQDIDDQSQSFSFAIDNASLFGRFRDFKTYKPEVAQKYIHRSILKRIRNEPLHNARVNFSKSKRSMTVHSPDNTDLNAAKMTLHEWENLYLNEYLNQNYYHQFTNHEAVLGIKPNHVEIAAASVPFFKPFTDSILNIVEIKDVRKVSNFILGFVQSIPYSTLESRLSSSGAGYSVPTKVLWENQGDCDSKMALTAAIMRAVMPRIDLVFVYLDDHAMLGVGIEPKGNDNYIRVNGNVYVLADPTGPRLMNLGELSFETEQRIKSNLYTAETFIKIVVDEEESVEE